MFTSCSDDNNDGGDGSSNGDLNTSCYILNQGNSSENNASLQVYDMVTGSASLPQCERDLFSIANNELLGDVAQDLLWIGERIFVTVSNSQKLEVLDENGKRVAKHVYAAEGACPRNMATDGDNVFVTNYDGYVYVYDAENGDSITRIYSGSYPEGISYCDGYVVVNNSNWGGYGGGDPSVSVIDVASRKVIKNITDNVCNPYGESVVCNGEVYIVDSGNYNDIPSKICKVDIENGTLAEIAEASLLSAWEDCIYFVNSSFSYETMSYNYSALYKMDVVSEKLTAIVPSEKMKDIYSLDVNPETGDVYAGYASWGVLGVMRVYDNDGIQRALFDVGYYTSGARFRN